MLSILIPAFNYDVRSLLQALVAQCRQLSTALAAEGQGRFAYEVLLADDASTDAALETANRTLAEQLAADGVRYLRQTSNMGRARNCNLLAREARGEYCLLIDCDALVCEPDFLRRYYEARDRADVVVGALRNPTVCPRGCELRWRYEQAAMPRRSVAYRAAHPYESLSTFNVLFHRRVLLDLPFDERCTEYGYEDALMGINLQLNGYSIAHIDAPLIHNGMDRNADFLRKTETGLRTLSRLTGPMQEHSALARLCERITRWHLRPLVLAGYGLLRPLLRWQLLGRRPALACFFAYKAGEYLRITAGAVR